MDSIITSLGYQFKAVHLTFFFSIWLFVPLAESFFVFLRLKERIKQALNNINDRLLLLSSKCGAVIKMILKSIRNVPRTAGCPVSYKDGLGREIIVGNGIRELGVLTLFSNAHF